MPEKIVQINEKVIKGQIKELVRGSVEETLNGDHLINVIRGDTLRRAAVAIGAVVNRFFVCGMTVIVLAMMPP